MEYRGRGSFPGDCREEPLDFLEFESSSRVA